MTSIVDVLSEHSTDDISDDQVFLTEQAVKQFFFQKRDVRVSIMGQKPHRRLLVYVENLEGDEFGQLSKMLNGALCPHGNGCTLGYHVGEISSVPGGVPT